MAVATGYDLGWHRAFRDLRAGCGCDHRAGDRVLHLRRVQHRRKGIAEQAKMGPATTIIDGLATGMFSAGIPVVTIVVGILCAFGFAGGFGELVRHGPLRHRLRRRRHARHARNHAGDRRLRADRRQRRRQRRDGRSGSRSSRAHRRAGFAGQHHRRDRQGLRHRLGRPDGHGPAGRLPRRGQDLGRQAGRRTDEYFRRAWHKGIEECRQRGIMDFSSKPTN